MSAADMEIDTNNTIMAHLLPAHLSHKSALVLMPPAMILAPIEAVRYAHDRHYARWPAHINLVYPFLRSPSDSGLDIEPSSRRLKQDIRMRIKRATAAIQPFRVALGADSLDTLQARNKKVIRLSPTTQAIQHLQAALQAEFTECNTDKRPFVPHLSLGQADDDDGEHLLRKEFTKRISDFLAANGEENATDLDWNVTRVLVIDRTGELDRFEVVEAINLGTQLPT